MTIRKTGTARDQQVDSGDDPGQGQGIQREAAQRQPEPAAPLSDHERREIIDGES